MTIRGVLLDAGGVLILPDAARIRAALAELGSQPDDDVLARCHYVAMRALDAVDGRDWVAGSPYLAAYARELGLDASDVLHLFDASVTGSFWVHPITASIGALRELERRRTPVVIVSNSGGEVSNELGLAGVCQVGPGGGVCVLRIIDSSVVGIRKPDPRIFHIALETLGMGPDEVIHIGDSVRFDVEGARAAGIRPIHLDPFGLCELTDHEHMTSLDGVLELL